MVVLASSRLAAEQAAETLTREGFTAEAGTVGGASFVSSMVKGSIRWSRSRSRTCATPTRAADRSPLVAGSVAA